MQHFSQYQYQRCLHWPLHCWVNGGWIPPISTMINCFEGSFFRQPIDKITKNYTIFPIQRNIETAAGGGGLYRGETLHRFYHIIYTTLIVSQMRWLAVESLFTVHNSFHVWKDQNHRNISNLKNATNDDLPSLTFDLVNCLTLSTKSKSM